MNFCIPLFHSKYFPFFNHKYFEFQLDKFKDGDYFRFTIKWTRKTHHAGPSLWMEFFGVFLSLDIYDNRHWNYEEEKWEDCDTEEEE